ncbi:ATP-dependent RNA helicase DDX19A-like [Styela clava]|uniref:ATP-dependent RNA helicase DDX19A-like n=1 Tax=Styela clava TaxID=7725 RepID=UPI001939A8BE|nr:ATP-dependent RNA helicase DDX19A-like [Styela clava]
MSNWGEEENWASAADAQENLSAKVKGIEIVDKKDNTQTDAAAASPTDTNAAAGDAKKEGPAGDKEEVEETALSAEQNSLMRKLIRDKLVQSSQKLEVQQRDPSSPLYSVKSFEQLNLAPELLAGVIEMGFNRPSKIQETALPLLLANPPENMIAQSQSGTGKTAAFVLAMLSRVTVAKEYPQCLCLSPTYELALQTGKVVEEMGKKLKNLSVTYAVRNNKVRRGEKITAHIIIGTPGTTQDWIKFEAFDPSKIEVFVLDEADVMIATQGFQDQSIRVHRKLSKNCQLLLFSATYEEAVMRFARKIVTEPNIIQLRREEETLDNIKQYFVKCTSKEKKADALSNIYSVLSVGQAIIFCATRKTAKWLAQTMCEGGFVVALLSGELDVEQRASILRRFKAAKERVLVTTNVCSRGIDVEQVTLVVNFDLPIDMQGRADCETYLHRIGRTGRFGKSGIAINFISQNRDEMVLREIEKHFGIKVHNLDTNDFDDMENKIGEK